MLRSWSLVRRSLALCAALCLLLSGTVSASNFGSNTAAYQTVAHACDTTTSSQCIANNGLHSYFLSTVEANQAAATRYACSSVYEPVYEVSCSEGTSSTNVDVVVYDGLYGTGFWGWTACASTASYGGSDPNRYCFPQVLKYDLSNQGEFNLQSEQRYLGCHEFGHSLGLRHSSSTSSCMYTSAASSQVLTSHDVSELNSHYQIPQRPVE